MPGVKKKSHNKIATRDRKCLTYVEYAQLEWKGKIETFFLQNTLVI